MPWAEQGENSVGVVLEFTALPVTATDLGIDTEVIAAVLEQREGNGAGGVEAAAES